MNIERLPILSIYDPTDPHPWFEISFNSNAMSIDYANYGGFELGVVDYVVSFEQLKSLAESSGEEIVVLVELDNSLSVVPKSQQPLECLAHIAWYDHATNTLRALQFIDGMAG